ncbi:hypothetical protein QLQ12_20145 [Actinoplanes sp. NEAU-A12]|uniref:Uncharacterized protein n=1 Tax=Actinoplanes sandaracinus TaxID=3045177 RepID=A0ABT6WMG6_9ACTN|nr:hypothetical protein [Actinoplanes sandaracinus]MDI6100929.1 hypothetical protein [Actinoplanes sandaracinus]
MTPTRAAVDAARGSGVPSGAAVTAGYSTYKRWPWVVPGRAPAGGSAAPLVIGGIPGLHPAVRAARLSPAGAVQSPRACRHLEK